MTGSVPRSLVQGGALLLLAAALSLALTACSGGAEDHPGHGIVRELDPDKRRIVLQHGEIPGFMKAMTMGFELAPEVDLEGVERGSEVDFRVKEAGGVYTVTSITPDRS